MARKAPPGGASPNPGLGEPNPEGSWLPIALNGVDHHCDKHRRVTDDDDLRLFQRLADPPERAVRVPADILISAQHLAAKGGGPAESGCINSLSRDGSFPTRARARKRAAERTSSAALTPGP
jgi:hypothetical protein